MDITIHQSIYACGLGNDYAMTRKKPPTQKGAQFITMWQALAGFATQSAGVGRAPSVGRKV